MAGGQARAVIFFLVLVIVSIIQVSLNKRREIEL
jgi:raffinose/stachyose/melibiose transport system permease protein